ncbi:phosphomannomutase [Gellertiella hungarica]|uniref:Phosphomannomutase n=1 Tax=Gellertiella hungarica TaxID=1572859 RepID=A0A7W6NLZ4_9HYPH|nr:phosphomannomutase [Gellertiella hungarica]MBB4066428.1 phosphomannomutase [Gellertiella hungarica]
MSLKFGTSGLRGLSTDLVGRASALYATAFGRSLLEAGIVAAGSAILIGRDFRPSSPEIAATAAAALEKIGFRPVDCGALPTPALAARGLAEGVASLMVTGSHIPADRNGIKFYRPDGEIDKADEQAIGAMAARLADDPAIGVATPARFPDEHAETVATFMARNRALLPQDLLRGKTIGIYQHSTVARDMLADLLSGLGAEVVALGRSDVFIPVDTEAVSAETLARLKAWAAEHRLDAIVSADGDGDRPLVADERGEPLRGDLLGLIAARFLGAQVVVTPVTSNSGIEAAGTFETRRTRVGSPFVIEGMMAALKEGRTGVMGFEANGGLLTASPFRIEGRKVAPLPTRDCFLPILAVLASSAEAGLSLRALAAEYRLPVADADRLENFPQEASSALMAHLRASPANLQAFLAPVGQVSGISDIDGLRVTLGDRSVIHFRPSGNAPEMRCYVEAADAAAARALLAKGLELIRDFQQLHG